MQDRLRRQDVQDKLPYPTYPARSSREADPVILFS